MAEFRWKRGVLHALIPLAAVIALGFLIVDPKPEIDRRALIDDGKTLRHPSLGFRLKRPPAEFHDAPALVKGMGDQGKDTVIYAYAPATPGAALIIGVMWGDDDFAQTVAGVTRGLQKSGASWDGEDIGADVAHLRAHMRNLTLRVDLHRIPGAIVTLNAMSPDPDALADVISSFQR